MSTPGTAAQPFTLLRTKLHQPQVRPEWVRRLRLEKRLNQGLDRKVTLVSAPAGFGKSSLVASSLAESDRHTTWLSLDEGDNDPVRFWTYVIAAIQAVDQEVGGEARQILGSLQLHSTKPVLVSLLNEVSELNHDLVLVLDDYHVIEAGQIHEALSYLLDHQPANLHIVLISRADPPISMARLRAHGWLVEIRATDLEFSAAEAALLFNDVMNLNLKPGQVAALTERTEGWIVGPIVGQRNIIK